MQIPIMASRQASVDELNSSFEALDETDGGSEASFGDSDTFAPVGPFYRHRQPPPDLPRREADNERLRRRNGTQVSGAG